MKKKQAIIQHPCVFTRRSLEDILQHSPLASSVNIVASVDSLADCHHHLQQFPATHLAILNMQGQDPTSDSHLGQVINRLRTHHPHSRVIVVAEAFCVPLLKQYFYGVSPVCAVIAHNAPLSEFVTQINQVFSAPMTPGRKRSSQLTGQEQTVLALLMQGQSNNAIAVHLRLSNKTISYHKRSMMSKLGFLIPPSELMDNPARIPSIHPSYCLSHAIVKLPFILKCLLQ